jgi:hypothetical protein
MELRSGTVRVVITALLLMCPPLLRATVLDPPGLRCVAVGAGGAATVTWTIPVDPTGEFLRYEVYRSNALAGPYTLVAPVGVYAQTSFTDATAGANAGARYYYLTTVSTSGPPNTSPTSDTLASIFIQVTQSVPLGSSVVDWNLPHTPPLGTSALSTDIRMEHPAGLWTQVGAVPNGVHHWQQVVSICQDSLNFQVQLQDGAGCSSVSNITGAMFQDITPPSVPVMAQVSVDTASNQAVVTWNPSPELDTQGYIIVLNTPGGNVILDTLYGRLDTTYTWMMSNAGAGAESYTIAAIDTCYKGTPPSPNTSATDPPHTSVFLTTTYDRCAGTILVTRTDYGGWPVDHYALYGQMDDTGPWSYLATMPTGTLDYLQANVLPGHSYCYVAKALGAQADQVSLSNQACLTTTAPNMPQWNYLRTATVTGSQEVLITDSADQTGFTRRLVLQRTNNGGPWEEVGALPGGMGPVVTFSDAAVSPADYSYNYRVLVEDTCGNTVVTSNLGTSIQLVVTPDPGGNNTLRWNGYVQWAGAVQGYAVYRSVAEGPFAMIGATASGQWQFVDHVESLYNTPGKFCYYVQALEVGNPAGINASSTSNTACAVQQEEVWVPNAFIEAGYNNTFKPVLAFADVEHYEFTIFNRWGQQIWTTADPEQPWDGRVGGSIVPQGVYAWYCSVRNGAGKTVEKKGTVTFIAGK